MKKLVILLILCVMAAAQPTDWFSAQTVRTELNISGTITLTAKGPDPLVQSVRADILFAPKNTPTSAIRKLETTPNAVTLDDRVRYEWKSPELGTLDFKYNSIVETSNNPPQILATIPWPTTFPSTVREYTQATTHIDSTHPTIIARAQYIARDQEDLASLVSATAAWVKNEVTYNLSTLTAEVSQKASWVLEQKTGVCDEITSLFIAMLRSLGIPAKFVSGIAYTASPQFPQGWGAHGWAEVYFPGVGWVPYDPTFGEYGWVDPSHIKLKESKDPQEPTSLYEWKARDVNVDVSDLHISAQLLSHVGTAPQPLRMTARALRDRAGFGSHNALIVTIENPTDSYRSVELSLSRVNDLTLLDAESKQATIPPRGTKTLSWHVKVNDNLNIQYQYEIPLHVHTIDNQTAKANFHSGRYDIVYSAQDIETAVELILPIKGPFMLACTLSEDTIIDADTTAHCTLISNSEEEQAVEACFNGCRTVALAPKARVPLEYPINAPQSGVHPITITAKTEEYTQQNTLTLARLDTPRVVVTARPLASATYGSTLPVVFTLARDSLAAPQNLTVSLSAFGASADLSLGALDAEQEVTINVPTIQLWQSSPTFTITVDYRDTLGNTHSSETETTAQVSGVPWYKRAIGAVLGPLFG